MIFLKYEARASKKEELNEKDTEENGGYRLEERDSGGSSTVTFSH